MKRLPFRKKTLYCLAWPLFDLIGRYTTLIAIFKKVDWKPIPHKSEITIDDILPPPAEESEDEKIDTKEKGEIVAPGEIEKEKKFIA